MVTPEMGGATWPLETRVFLSAAATTLTVWLLLPQLLDPASQLLLLLVGVALLGLPHGALDPVRAWRSGFCYDGKSLLLFHLAYIGAALAVLLFWGLFPVLALGAFLLLGAWHFAGDWQGSLPLPVRLAVGLSIICLPAGLHPAATGEVFRLLAGEQAEAIVDALAVAAVPLLILLLAIAASRVRRNPRVGLEIGAIAITGYILPPLLFFLLYFGLLHNGRHLLTAYYRTAADGRSRLVVVALLYTLLTLVLALLILPRLEGEFHRVANRLVFIGLAALTFPHMVLSLLISRRASF